MNILWDTNDAVQLLLSIIKIFIPIQVRIVFCLLDDKTWMIFILSGLNTRDGTNLDASRLEGTFLSLGFETEVYHNRTAMQILTTIEQGRLAFRFSIFYFVKFSFLAAKRDYSQCDCFIFVFLSHGDERDIIYGCDQPIKISALTEPFKRSANSLLGKPKIFIFQVNSNQYFFSIV